MAYVASSTRYVNPHETNFVNGINVLPLDVYKHIVLLLLPPRPSDQSAATAATIDPTNSAIVIFPSPKLEVALLDPPPLPLPLVVAVEVLVPAMEVETEPVGDPLPVPVVDAPVGEPEELPLPEGEPVNRTTQSRKH
ncbi:hypothetical protein FRC18_006922 [Serendipita sp. 400]|nr:hypothetical protein FRC18_006922 [Serendipita sp. 400]